VRALTISEEGRLDVVERPKPEPGPGEVVVRVHGAGLNRADLLQRAGLYPPPPGVPADVPGLEFAGVVTEAGPGVTRLDVGARVFGIVGGGAQAEYVLTRESHCALVPDSIDLVDAGGVPEAFLTAHDALRSNADLRAGERVLVHAAGSGVGTAVVQLAHAFGCPVTGTARTEAKLAAARKLGLDHSVLVQGGLDPAALAARITAEAGPPDVIVDLVGGDYLVADVLAAAPLARIVIVGTLAGGSAQLPILPVMGKRLTLVGTVLRPRSADEKTAATAAFAAEVGPLLTDGTVRPIVERVVPLADAEEAYGLLASDTTFGKVVLSTGS
jgi:NADPH:quinone reductase